MRSAHARALRLAAQRFQGRAREDVGDAVRKHRPQEGGSVQALGALVLGDATPAFRPPTVERTFDSLDDVTQGDFCRPSRQGVASPRSSFALHELGTSKPLEDLLKVAGWNALPFADHPDLDRLALAVVSEVEYPAYGVLDLER